MGRGSFASKGPRGEEVEEGEVEEGGEEVVLRSTGIGCHPMKGYHRSEGEDEGEEGVKCEKEEEDALSLSFLLSEESLPTSQ